MGTPGDKGNVYSAEVTVFGESPINNYNVGPLLQYEINVNGNQAGISGDNFSVSNMTFDNGKWSRHTKPPNDWRQSNPEYPHAHHFRQQSSPTPITFIDGMPIIVQGLDLGTPGPVTQSPGGTGEKFANGSVSVFLDGTNGMTSVLINDSKGVNAVSYDLAQDPTNGKFTLYNKLNMNNDGTWNLSPGIPVNTGQAANTASTTGLTTVMINSIPVNVPASIGNILPGSPSGGGLEF